MSSNRRPTINHKNCAHEATPAARKACRKAFWAKQPSPEAKAMADRIHLGWFDGHRVEMARSSAYRMGMPWEKAKEAEAIDLCEFLVSKGVTWSVVQRMNS